MRTALRAYAKMIDTLERSSQPCLLLSYDKCLQRPVEAVDAIAEFLGVERPDTTAAVAFIRRDPTDYLRRSRLRRRRRG